MFAKKATKLVILLTSVVCTWPAMSETLPRPTSPPRVELPELIVSPQEALPHGGQAAGCLTRFEVSGVMRNLRRAIMIEFLSKAYAKTNGWKSDFVAAGVDFINFESLYIFSRQSCVDASNVISMVAGLFSHCPLDAACAGLTITGHENLSGWPLGAALPGADQGSSFIRKYGANALSSCLFQIVGRPTVSPASMYEIDSKIHRAMRIYRLPFWSVLSRDRKVFFLMSRECSSKPEAFSYLSQALSNMGVDLKADFFSPDFNPGSNEYIKLFPPQ